MASRSKKLLTAAFFAGILALLLFFFLRLHPLIVYDADDWTYISYSRSFFPSLSEYNPARIFPETVMGLLSKAALRFVYPLTRDYIGSIALIYGIALCLFILLYLFEFYRFIVSENPKIGTPAACLLTGLFLLFHFSVFKIHASHNSYLFRARDLTCFFYYIIPNLMNASLAMFLIRKCFDLRIKKHHVAAVLLIPCGYFCVFSNIFMTGILMSAVGLDLLCTLFLVIARKMRFGEALKSRWYSLLLVLFWVVMLYFESRGKRAKTVGRTFTLSDSLRSYAGWRHSLNRLTVLIALICLISGVIIGVVKRRSATSGRVLRLTAFLAGCFVIESAFLIMLCGKTGAQYMIRADVIFGIPFYGFLLVFTCAAYVLNCRPQAALLLLVLGALLLADTGYGQQVFDYSFVRDVTPAQARAIDDDLIHHVLRASEEGKTVLTLRVPKGNDTDNWPHAYYLGTRMSHTLAVHGLIDHEMGITIQPDRSLNRKYHLNYDG